MNALRALAVVVAMTLPFAAHAAHAKKHTPAPSDSVVQPVDAPDVMPAPAAVPAPLPDASDLDPLPLVGPAPGLRSVYFVVATHVDEKARTATVKRGVAFAYEADGDDCVLATAQHVIAGADHVNVYRWRGDLTPATGFEAHVKWANADKDVAALAVALTDECKPVARNQAGIPLGQPVYAYLNANGSRGMMTRGTIGGYWAMPSGPAIVCDMNVHRGQSGSPLFDADGLLLGMVLSRSQDSEMSGGFALPANRIETEFRARRALPVPVAVPVDE